MSRALLRHLSTTCIAVLTATAAQAVEPLPPKEPYATGALFTRPLIGVEGGTVTITFRPALSAAVQQPVGGAISITAPDGRTRTWSVDLQPEGEAITGRLEWKAWHNGVYRVSARVDQASLPAGVKAKPAAATIDLPVVVPGRRPHFPWFGQRETLRWATIWAGAFNKDMIAHWQERGVMPLAWKWGSNHPGDMDAQAYTEYYSDFGGTEGIAVDECGYYPETLDDGAGVGKFTACLKGMAAAKALRPEGFFLNWHTGALYPEQAAMYRKACDLVVVESYALYFAPRALDRKSVV